MIKLSKIFMKNFQRLEFITSLASASLLYILTIYQYIKDKPYYLLVLIAALLMSANAYLKYKIYKKS
ncbi:hypothetical protein HMPREF3200_00157 [Anaerococcus tetradius]|uniref:Uncharacterized protein n=2 Tax=Anaerococcus tetradius TaxID=33036 RepID=A0A133KHP6_9FIRM|nr:hypothetical protein HMPREF3200_00157 [Anaerococcus tetradius]